MQGISENNNGFAIASLVLGIVSVAFCFFGTLIIIGLACGIVGIVLAAKGQNSHKKGFATAGLVLSIVGVSLGAVFLIFAFCVMKDINNVISQFNF